MTQFDCGVHGLDTWGWVHIRQVTREPKKMMHGLRDRRVGSWMRLGVCQPSPRYIYVLKIYQWEGKHMGNMGMCGAICSI